MVQGDSASNIDKLNMIIRTIFRDAYVDGKVWRDITLSLRKPISATTDGMRADQRGDAILTIDIERTGPVGSAPAGRAVLSGRAEGSGARTAPRRTRGNLRIKGRRANLSVQIHTHLRKSRIKDMPIDIEWVYEIKAEASKSRGWKLHKNKKVA